MLSERTESSDRGEKFEGYRTIPSLRHYVMVSSRHVLVEHYVRTDDGWLLRAYGPGDEVHIQSPDVVLTVDELCRMAFEADAG